MEQEPEIYITWGFYNESHHGNMRVLLNPFLLGDGRTITKAKKLIKYIRKAMNRNRLNILRISLNSSMLTMKVWFRDPCC